MAQGSIQRNILQRPTGNQEGKEEKKCKLFLKILFLSVLSVPLPVGMASNAGRFSVISLTSRVYQRAAALRNPDRHLLRAADCPSVRAGTDGKRESGRR